MKIIHISDLHFGMHCAKIVDAFYKDIITINPDIIIISGDVTQRAKTPQYQAFQTFTQQLPGTVLCVPGNHDIPLHNVLSRLFSPFKQYNHYVGNVFANNFENDFLRILGVNSVDPYQVKNGKLSQRTLQNIEHHFLKDDKRLNLLFFHHNFDYIDGMHHPLKNDDDFLIYLKNSPLHIVCTGHLHFSHIGLIKKDNQHSCLVLHAGSLLCERTRDGLNSYYLIEENNLQCSIQLRVYKKLGFEIQSTGSIDFSKQFAEFKEEMFPTEFIQSS